MLKATGELKTLNSCPQEPPNRFISRLVAALRWTARHCPQILSARTPVFCPAGEDDHDRAQDEHPYRCLTGVKSHKEEVDEQSRG